MEMNLNKFVYESDDFGITFETCNLEKIVNQFNTDKDNGRVIFKTADHEFQYGYINTGKFEEYEEKFQ